METRLVYHKTTGQHYFSSGTWKQDWLFIKQLGNTTSHQGHGNKTGPSLNNWATLLLIRNMETRLVHHKTTGQHYFSSGTWKQDWSIIKQLGNTTSHQGHGNKTGPSS